MHFLPSALLLSDRCTRKPLAISEASSPSIWQAGGSRLAWSAIQVRGILIGRKRNTTTNRLQ
jgi:hypothetical protein